MVCHQSGLDRHGAMRITPADRKLLAEIGTTKYEPPADGLKGGR